MKKLFTFLFALLLTIPVFSQDEAVEEDPDGWTKGGTGSITFNQTGLKNWSAGGDPSISFLALVNYHTRYKKGKHLWQGQGGAEYGLQKIKGDPFRKNSDRIELTSKYGYAVAEKVYFSVLANFKSQFSKTFNFDDDGNKVTPYISRFASPAVVELSTGIDYVPNAFFSLYVSPVAGKFTIVRDTHIKPTYNVPVGDRARSELGALLVATYTQQVHANVNLNSVLKVFKDYLNGPAENIDVDWQTTIGMTVTKFITANVFMHLIWDWDTDTNTETAEIERKVQFKDVIGVGLAFNLGAKTE